MNLTNFQTSGLHLNGTGLCGVFVCFLFVGKCRSLEGLVSGSELAEVDCLLEAVGAAVAGYTQAPAFPVPLHCKDM